MDTNPRLRRIEVDQPRANGKIKPHVAAVQPDLPLVVFHGRELGSVNGADPYPLVGLAVGDFGHPRLARTLPNAQIGPTRQPQRKEVREVLKPHGAAAARGSSRG